MSGRKILLQSRRVISPDLHPQQCTHSLRSQNRPYDTVCTNGPCTLHSSSGRTRNGVIFEMGSRDILTTTRVLDVEHRYSLVILSFVMPLLESCGGGKCRHGPALNEYEYDWPPSGCPISTAGSMTSRYNFTSGFPWKSCA